jgi:FkbM family methyltransferase
MTSAIKLLNALVLLYSAHTPYHPGKWKVLESLICRFRLEKFYQGKTFTVKRNGLLWNLQPDCLVQRAVYYLSYYEVKETRWLKKQVKADWVFFDVGANFGYYSMIVSKFSGGQARIYAFEPFAPIFASLQRNKELNGLENVLTFKLALSDKEGEIEFLAPPVGNLGGGKISPVKVDAQPRAVSERVKTTTLDAFAQSHAVAKIDFIKVDVEGAEMMLLSGAKETIGRCKPVMMIEFNPQALADFGASAEGLLKEIHSLGFKTWTIESSGLQIFEDVRTIKEYRNVICIPQAERT